MTNEYDRTGRLAVTILRPISKSGVNQAVAPYTSTGLPARPAPSVPLPYMDSRTSRRRLVKQTEHSSAMAAAIDAATRVYISLASLEFARQEAERVHAARRHLPIFVETERTTLLAGLLRATADLTAIRVGLEQQRLEHDQQRQLAPAQTERLRLALEDDLAQAQADAEGRRAELADQRATPSEVGEMPEALRQHLAAELEVNRNRTPALQLAQEIRERAAAAKRPLTPEEAEIVDLLESAAAGAEDSIRRGAASDFEE